MKSQILSKAKYLTTLAIVSCALFTDPATTLHAGELSRTDFQLRTLERRLNLLELDEITYGPIQVSHVHLGHSKHFEVVPPGQTIHCSFDYQLDSSQQEFLSKRHLIVGLGGVAAETCATHLYGVWDSKGTAKFQLIAPLEEGDYEVRIAYRSGANCQEALNSWNVLGDEPDSFATIGILRVRNIPVLNY